MLAKAVAKEAHAVFLYVSGADFLSKWVGEDEKLVRAVFSLARKLDPCVIFVDEADAVFRERTNDDASWRRDLISQFLLEWDGVTGNSKGGFVMAASNRMSDIDPAVLRRLPRRIFIGNPSAEHRENILRTHLKDEILGPDVDLAQLAKRAGQYTGSDLKNLCVSAAMAAVYEEVLEQMEHHDHKNGGSAAKKGRRPKRKQPRRMLCYRHFEQALKEIGATPQPDSKATKPMAPTRDSNIDAASLAKLKELWSDVWWRFCRHMS